MRGLWQNPDFLKLWAAQAVSVLGSNVTSQALPLVALITLRASPVEMGALAAVESAPALVIGLLAGVWVDRLRRRPILIAADLGRALLLLSIPLAAVLGRLTMEQLYVVAALTGALTLFFDVADQSFLPTVVRREELVEGNSKLGVTGSVAEIAGPPLGGILVQTITAPFAILVDALSFLVSALFLGLIRKPEQPPVPSQEHPGIRQEIAEGLRVVFHNPVLRAVTAASATFSFFGGFFYALYGLYVIRELGLTPFVLGAFVGAGGAGALVGAFLAGRIARRFGVGSTLTGSMALIGVIGIGTPLAAGPEPLVIGVLMAVQFFGDAAIAVYLINEVSLRQTLVPDRLLGRANASVHFLVGGVIPTGAILGGVLGEYVGMRTSLLIAVAGILLGSLWLISSPVRTLKSNL